MWPWDNRPGDAQWAVTGGGGPPEEQAAIGAVGLSPLGRAAGARDGGAS